MNQKAPSGGDSGRAGKRILRWLNTLRGSIPRGHRSSRSRCSGCHGAVEEILDLAVGDAGHVVASLLVNYQGKARTAQRWTFALKDPVDGAYALFGDNTDPLASSLVEVGP